MNTEGNTNQVMGRCGNEEPLAGSFHSSPVQFSLEYFTYQDAHAQCISVGKEGKMCQQPSCAIGIAIWAQIYCPAIGVAAGRLSAVGFPREVIIHLK